MPLSSASRTRPGVTSTIRALPCRSVVSTPACEPVNDCASAPNDSMAIATSALDIRSPAVSNISISRAGGTGFTCAARSRSSSVVSPIAEHTTTTSFPCFLVATIRSATRRIRSALSSEDPPYFCTINATRQPPFQRKTMLRLFIVPKNQLRLRKCKAILLLCCSHSPPHSPSPGGQSCGTASPNKPPVTDPGSQMPRSLPSLADPSGGQAQEQPCLDTSCKPSP